MPEGAVYVSYSGGDLQAVTALSAALKAANITIWRDIDRHLVPGDDFEQTARKNIMACSYFLAVFSENTARQREGFYRREWRWAAERAEKLSNSGEPFVMPILIDATNVDESSPPESFLLLNASSAPGGIPDEKFINRLSALLAAKTDH
ncbi:MAG: toll/interleukin-1 receptor domain-containing protein [Verrucomicrobia bacterium]|nr:toll/interleukin-1 receptor domain-containing protein [Verrucomicrobiota bacterium]